MTSPTGDFTSNRIAGEMAIFGQLPSHPSEHFPGPALQCIVRQSSWLVFTGKADTISCCRRFHGETWPYISFSTTGPRLSHCTCKPPVKSAAGDLSMMAFRCLCQFVCRVIAPVLLAISILPAQVVTTTAGGYVGDGGDPTLAGLAFPRFVLQDSSGVTYITHAGNHRIRTVINGAL